MKFDAARQCHELAIAYAQSKLSQLNSINTNIELSTLDCENDLEYFISMYNNCYEELIQKHYNNFQLQLDK